MLMKNISVIISILILICVSVTFGQKRGSREYIEEYPETRALPNKLDTLIPIDTLEIDKNINTFDIKPTSNKTLNYTKSDFLKPSKISSLEQLNCSKCLNEKYLKHYYAKGCKPVEGELSQHCKKPCPQYFNCPKKSIKASPTGCEYNGRIYKINDEVPVDNPCKRNCFCDQNSLNLSNPKITCADVECFGDFSHRVDCYNYYEFGKCCSTRRECPTNDELQNMNKCLYDGKQYKLGERIYPRNDPCIECVCNDQWNQRSPLNSSACRQINCDFELHPMFKEGCVPIYHKHTCCPVDYHCPSPKQMHCLFDGHEYRIGEKLNTGNVKVDCTCLIPPEFTCIQHTLDPLRPQTLQKSEPIRPSENLRPFNQTQQIRASELLRPFNKTQKINPSEHLRPFNITEQQIDPSKNLRPFNKTQQQINPSEHLRPFNKTQAIKPSEHLRPFKPNLNKSNKCPPYIEEGLQCPGYNCTTILDANGCQACSCERPCPELECNDPCYMFAVTPGECPKCKCP